MRSRRRWFTARRRAWNCSTPSKPTPASLIITAWTPFERICWNSPETARPQSDTTGRRQARQGASRSVTTFSRRPRDSQSNCDQSAIEYAAARKTAQRALIFAQFGLKVAFVETPERVDPKWFGEMAPRNRGVNVRVFTNVEDAEEWLLR